MPKIKHRYLYLLITITLLLAILIFRTQLSELAISATARSAGLKEVSLDIHQLGLSQSRISSIKFKLIAESGQYLIAASDLQLDYKLSQLPGAKLDSVAIASLSIQQLTTRTAENISPDTTEPLQAQLLLKNIIHTLNAYAIFNTFTIQKISLHGEIFGPLHDKTLSLNSVKRDGQITATLSHVDALLPEQSSNKRRLIITLNESSITAEAQLPARPELSPARLEFHFQDAAISGNFRLNIPQLEYWMLLATNLSDASKASDIKGTVQIDFNSTDRIISKIKIGADKLIFSSYTIDKPALVLLLNNPATGPLSHTAIHKGSHFLFSNLSHDNIFLGKTKIDLLGELTRSGKAWKYEGDTRSESLAINFDSQVLKLKDITLHTIADSEHINTAGDFSLARLPGQFAFTLSHSLVEDLGRLSIKPLSSLSINSENHRLSQLLTPWPYPFDLLTGDIKLAIDAAWSQQHDFRLSADVKLTDAGGNYNELLFSGLNFEHRLDLLPNIRSTRASAISLKHLDSGISVSNIISRIDLRTPKSSSQPQLTIRGLYGEIFGGTFMADDFVFDLNKNQNKFKIMASNIDLAEIVKTQQFDSLVVTGKVDGTIPVIVDQQGVSIEHGTLINNVRDGTIRYNPGDAESRQLKQNPLTGIALDALKDFRYSYLSAGINFTPEGLLSINLELKGTSPELDSKRPVNLNINTEQNLTALLKSLRFAYGISDNIDKKVRQQYEKHNSKN